MPTVPLLYVDPAAGLCGPVEAESVSPHVAVVLLTAPPLAPGEVAAFRAEAARLGDRLPVLPARQERRRLAPCPAGAVAGDGPAGLSFLHQNAYALAGVPRIPVADLSFDYAGTRLHWKTGGPPLQWMEDGVLVTAGRQPAEERRALVRLEEAGLAWLQFLAAHGFGGILADDMGLGKTLQAPAHLLAEKEAGRLDRRRSRRPAGTHRRLRRFRCNVQRQARSAPVSASPDGDPERAGGEGRHHPMVLGGRHQSGVRSAPSGRTAPCNRRRIRRLSGVWRR
nr:SNF2-related protein [Azospirillum picis]